MSIFDLAVQATGDVQAALGLIQLNGVDSLDSAIPPGVRMRHEASDEPVAKYFQTQGVNVVTETSLPADPTAEQSKYVPGPFTQPIADPIPEPEPVAWLVVAGQSIFDISLQVYGNIESALLLARENAITLNSSNITHLKLAYTPANNEVVNTLRLNSLVVATDGALLTDAKSAWSAGFKKSAFK